MPEPAWGEASGPSDPDDEGEEAPADPRLWFLRDPGALARRLVLAEILGERAHLSGARERPTTKRR